MRDEQQAGRDLTLVIDQGGHATRCIVFDDAGDVVSRNEIAIATHRPMAGNVEHDPLEILASVRDCLSSTASALGEDASRVSNAAMCTQRSSIVCWSRNTTAPLSPVLSWQDTRANAYLESLALDDVELHAITGLVRSPHYGASKMRWCIDNLPTVAEAKKTGDLAMGPLAAYLIHALSEGQTDATDAANGSRTLLYDLESGDWSPRLLQLFGIDMHCLPKIIATRSDWGSLDFAGQALPLSVVTGDQSAVPYAFSDQPEGFCFLNLGTGAFLQCPVRRRCEVPGLLNSVICKSAEQTYYSVEGTVNGAGAALSWLAESENLSEEELFTSLSAWIEQVDSPPLFLNTVGGIGSPFWKPGRAPCYDAEADLPHKAIAVVESIAFLINCNLEAMRTAGIDIEEILVSGGLSSLTQLLQSVATLSGLPVRRSEYAEATAYGGARLCRRSLPTLAAGDRYRPEEKVKPALERRFEKWIGLMRDG